jgi:hypothetical protein
MCCAIKQFGVVFYLGTCYVMLRIQFNLFHPVFYLGNMLYDVTYLRFEFNLHNRYITAT